MIKVSFPGGLGVELIWSSCSLTSPHPVTAGMQQEQDFTRNVASTSNNLINRDLAGGHPRIATRRRGYCWPEGRSPSSREPQLVVPCAQPAGSPLGGEGWSSSCISRASVVACGLVTTISTRDFAEQHAQAAERPRSSCMTRPIGHAPRYRARREFSPAVSDDDVPGWRPHEHARARTSARPLGLSILGG